MCPACNRPLDHTGALLILDAITDPAPSQRHHRAGRHASLLHSAQGQQREGTRATNPRTVRSPRLLIISVATLARPDAAYDVSTDPKLRQWTSERRVLNLNPAGRRQTKKYRATVRVARQVAHHLDVSKGFFVGPKNTRSAWEGMCAELELPGDGEAGQKLIRRSMAHLLRSRGVPIEQVELMLGHRKMDSTSEIYAPFDPSYLADAVAEIEAIVDEVETLVPGAFSRRKAGDGADVIPIDWRKIA